MNGEELKALLAAKIGIPQELVTRDADLVCDLGADSLCLADIIGIIESETSKKIPVDCLPDISTVGDLEDLVTSMHDENVKPNLDA